MQGLKDLEILLRVLDDPKGYKKHLKEMKAVIESLQNERHHLAEAQIEHDERQKWLAKWNDELEAQHAHQQEASSKLKDEAQKLVIAKQELAVKEALVNDKAADAADQWEGAVALAEQNAQIADMLAKDEEDLKAREAKLAEKEAALHAAMAG